MVLSQLRTFTVVSAMSITLPSAPNFFISIQSSGRSMSLAESWMPATKPRMLSLNTSSSTAVMAPRPLSSTSGERSSSAENMMMRKVSVRMIFTTCT